MRSEAPKGDQPDEEPCRKNKPIDLSLDQLNQFELSESFKDY